MSECVFFSFLFFFNYVTAIGRRLYWNPLQGMCGVQVSGYILDLVFAANHGIN